MIAIFFCEKKAGKNLVQRLFPVRALSSGLPAMYPLLGVNVYRTWVAIGLRASRTTSCGRRTGAGAKEYCAGWCEP